MAFEKARDCLAQFGLEDRIHIFEVSTATVELAAQAVGCEPARIAKTLSLELSSEGCVLVVCAGDVKIDNHKFKETFHTKAKMLSAERAEALTGHRVGGVCPFGVPDGTRICLDASLRRFDVVYPACGTSNTAVRLTLEELERVTGGEWVDVCKSVQG